MAGHGQHFADIERAFFQQNFKLFTKATFEDPEAEYIFVKDLGECLRMCGHAPFECEVAEFAKMADPEGTGRLNFDTVLDCVFASFTRMHSIEELKEAFRAFDPDMRGIVSITDLRHILTNYGEKLTDAEMNEFVQEAQSEMDSDGLIMFDGLVTKFLPSFLNQ
jgi:calmodulin